MKIALLQAHSAEIEQLYQLTVLNHIQYVAAHKYDMIQLYSESYKKILYGYLEYIKDFLPKYDYIFSIGADVIITDINKPLSHFIDDNYGVIISLEDLGGSKCNFDVLLWQNNQKCFDLINKIEEMLPLYINNPFGLQEIFNQILIQKLEIGKTHIKYVPGRTIQSFPYNCSKSKWQEGDFSIHFLGMSNDDKITKCQHFLNTRNVIWK
jgi:hypothetical protein